MYHIHSVRTRYYSNRTIEWSQNITINMNTSKYVDGCECECACGGVDHSASQMNVPCTHRSWPCEH